MKFSKISIAEAIRVAKQSLSTKKVKLSQEKLTDGTLIQYDGLEIVFGTLINGVDPSGNVFNLPDGQYQTKSSGTRFTIKNGVAEEVTPGQPILEDDETRHQAQSKTEAGDDVELNSGDENQFDSLTDSGAAIESECLPNEEDMKKDSNKPYGDVEYAYIDKDDNHKYPIDTEEHVRAAWNYINKKHNSALVEDVTKVKSKIIAAWKKKIDPKGPPSAQKAEANKKSPQEMEKIKQAELKELLKKLSKFITDDAEANAGDDNEDANASQDMEDLDQATSTFDAEAFEDLKSKFEEMQKAHATKLDELAAKFEDLTKKFNEYGKENQKLKKQVQILSKQPAGDEAGAGDTAAREIEIPTDIKDSKIFQMRQLMKTDADKTKAAKK